VPPSLLAHRSFTKSVYLTFIHRVGFHGALRAGRYLRSTPTPLRALLKADADAAIKRGGIKTRPKMLRKLYTNFRLFI
jgi:hypothetical protein